MFLICNVIVAFLAISFCYTCSSPTGPDHCDDFAMPNEVNDVITENEVIDEEELEESWRLLPPSTAAPVGNEVNVSTDELNRKFDEFIRKMKEEIRIGDQRQLIDV
ncbi:hypothetical protein Acr_07g0008710 [Actinidia rufa]|uniref:Uncharacterized protein n=1 Tax=Actinidia rufa TaxID=165716 RepID=A0A7J0EW21_9ERIC|nr:hypothetical protein Acr_07g0008710 [Actinidia rufa]